MKTYYLILLSISILLSCKCEGTFITETKIQNNTSSQIQIMIFGSKNVTYVLNPSEKKTIGVSSGRTKGISFSIGDINFSDSIVIKTNNKKVVFVNSAKSSTIESDKIYLQKNYKENILFENNCRLETEFVYFIE